MKTRVQLAFVATGILLIGSLIVGVVLQQKQTRADQPEGSPNPGSARHSLSIADLLELPRAELEHTDVALLNLLVAQQLSGAGEFSISNQLAMLDQWATRVRTETDRHLYRFRANPAEFEHSEGYFRMLMMAVVFYEDFNVRYNPERVSNPGTINPNDRFFADSRDIFLHGLLGSRRMGTCSSLPVLYVAVGRRLGYPLKLVTTKAHLFLRWEDSKERFNLEATGRGMNRYDDEHFKRRPFVVTEEEIKAEGYLKSLNAAEELAVFLSLRGNCLKEAGRMEEAATCYAQAARLAPASRSYALLVADLRQSQAGYGAIQLPGAGPEPNPLRKLKPR